MAENLVLIPLGGEVLALDAEAFAQALERGRGVSPQRERSGAAGERLLTAQELEAATSVPSSWWLESARQGRVPHRRIGRYPRFVMSEILACEAFKGRAE